MLDDRTVLRTEVVTDDPWRDLVGMLAPTPAGCGPTVHDRDPDGADRRRYLALLLDGLRPAPGVLPPPSHQDPGGR